MENWKLKTENCHTASGHVLVHPSLPVSHPFALLMMHISC